MGKGGGGKSTVGGHTFTRKFEFLFLGRFYGKGVLSALCPVLEMSLLFQERKEEEIDSI